MKRFILITAGLLLGLSNITFAQFNTVTQSKAQHKALPILPSISVTHANDKAIDAISSKQNVVEQTGHLQAFVSPLRRIAVTSPFGWRTDPLTKRKAKHNGLDLKAYYEPTYAMTYGEVANVGRDNRSGLYIVLRHGSLTISYCNLSKVIVTKGTCVHPGTTIALTGNSGRSTGPHLHLTLKKDGKTINPAILINLIKQTPMDNMFADNNIHVKD